VPVEFIYNTKFRLKNESDFNDWIKEITISEGFSVGNLNYAFFDDEGLKALNNKFLNHDYYTDVISFNESKGFVINGDIAISVERVKENSTKYNTFFEKEMLRVMAHGLLHLMGFDDKTDLERIAMQNAENIKIKMFHVEQ
jgi:rRNA maturation RNase YbeY